MFSAKPTNPPEQLSKEQPPNFAGSHQLAENSSDSEGADSEEEEEEEQQQKDVQTNGREEQPSVEAMQQARSRVPATLSISHILSGASREDQQHSGGTKLREAPVQGTPQGATAMHPAAAPRQIMRSPESRERLAPPNEHMNRVPVKGPFENVAGRASYDNAHGRVPYGMAPNEGLERVGPHGEPRRQESHEHAFGMKFNDRKLLGNVAESVIKKAPQNSTPEMGAFKKMPELRPIKGSYENDVEEKQSRDRTLESVSENGHLEPGKTETIPQRMPAAVAAAAADMNKHLKEGQRAAPPFKSWPEAQPGSFLQELNDAGPPSAGSNIGDKPGLEKNHRLPFTSMLRGISPSAQGSPENRSQYLTLEAAAAANRERMRENMMAGNFLHSPEVTEKQQHERFNPAAAARAADMSAYAAMYANKRPSEMMPPLQYRPNLHVSAMAHQRNMESAAQMPPGVNAQFVDLNSVQYRYPSGMPARESLTREQMYFLEQQQRRQQMASSMDAMMAGGQPERMMGYGGMLRQQQLFNAAYASHMRNGEFPGFPNEGERLF